MLRKLTFRAFLLRKQGLSCSAINFDTPYNKRARLGTMQDPWPVVEKRKPEPDEVLPTENKKLRVKRKMYALLLAYNGQGYLGLQRNMGCKTIEEDIMEALKKLQIISEEEFLKQQLLCFQRAARTDKGVSALRQVLNLQLQDGITADDFNKYLPEQIRLLAVKRVTKGFNSKNSCDYRTYSYTCPSFAFTPKDLNISEDFRISEELISKLNQLTQDFVGTHNFHNFTSGRKPLDPSCNRHIMSIECQKPVIRENLEFVTFLIKGQSFMLHQIRKMMGTVMAITRGYVKEKYIVHAFCPKASLQLPIAPGLGLLLEQVHYDWYNKKYGENGFHEKLDFQDVEHLVTAFRDKQIYPILLQEEKENKSMLTYLDTLQSHYEEYHNDSSDVFSTVALDNPTVDTSSEKTTTESSVNENRCEKNEPQEYNNVSQ